MIPGLTCACGSADIFALDPGQDPARRGAVDLFTRHDPVIDRGAPTVARCMACVLVRWLGMRREVMGG